MHVRRLIFLLAIALASTVRADVISGPLSMAASTRKRILVVRVGPTEVRRYSIAVGSKNHPTPMGHFSVRHIVWNPDWNPPDAPWAKGKKPLPGGHPDNPMKVVKIFFSEPDYYIHGTDNEQSIGEAASHGCIRMAESDAVDLARYLMEHDGAHHDDSWYDSVQSSAKPTDVRLPYGVPMVIGK